MCLFVCSSNSLAMIDQEIADVVKKMQNLNFDISRPKEFNSREIQKLSKILRDYIRISSEKGEDFQLYKYLISPTFDVTVCDSGLKNFANVIVQLNDKEVAIGFIDCSIGIFDLATGVRIHSFYDHNDRISSLCVLKDGNLVSGSDDGEVIIWDLKTYDKHISISAHTGSVLSIIELDEQKIATGSADSMIKIWNMDGSCERILAGHSAGVSSLVRLNQEQIVSGSWDHTVKIWDIGKSLELKTLSGHSDFVTSLVCLDRNTIISTSDDESFIVWDIQSGSCLRQIQGSDGFIMSSCLISNGLFVTSSSNGNVIIWSPLHGMKLARFYDPSNKSSFAVCMVKQMLNGNLIALSDDKILRVFDCYPMEIRKFFDIDAIFENLELIALIIALEKPMKAQTRISIDKSWLKLFCSLPRLYKDNYSNFLNMMYFDKSDCSVM